MDNEKFKEKIDIVNKCKGLEAETVEIKSITSENAVEFAEIASKYLDPLDIVYLCTCIQAKVKNEGGVLYKQADPDTLENLYNHFNIDGSHLYLKTRDAGETYDEITSNKDRDIEGLLTFMSEYFTKEELLTRYTSFLQKYEI